MLNPNCLMSQRDDSRIADLESSFRFTPQTIVVATVKQSSGSEELNNAALECIKKAQFQPAGEADGRSVNRLSGCG